jgi:hypothetical protein
MSTETERAAKFRAAFDYLLAEVRQAVPADTEVFFRRKFDLIAWKGTAARSCFWLCEYNRENFRIHSIHQLIRDRRDLPKKFWRPGEQSFRLPRSELSFHKSLLPYVRGRDIYQFFSALSLSASRDWSGLYEWPLFMSRGDSPDYAWADPNWRPQPEHWEMYGSGYEDYEE